MTSEPSWQPFQVELSGKHGDAPRSIDTALGVGDRLRAAAFAELQAREAFDWAAARFEGDAPPELTQAWKMLARAEERHLSWLLKRMEELQVDPSARRVSDHLWKSLMGCESAKVFAHFMANAEDRGRKAGERFYEAMKATDPVTAEIFRKIAEEEIEHIRLAEQFYPTSS